MENMHRENTVFGVVIAQIQAANIQTIALVTTSVLLCATYITRRALENRGQKFPPHIPSSIPFLGQAINFNKSPVEFLVAASQKYGPVFSFTMVGKTFTYLVSSEASALFFNSKNENLNAEEVYNKLTAPVFGKGVAYDCPNSLFLEQKKMLKTGMNIARYRLYIPMMEEETVEYFKRWGSSGEKDIFLALSQLIILTASRCLHGKEIRSIMDDSIAQHYWDMDGGFTPEAWLLPGWFPLPSSIKRDKAHKKMKEIFHKVIQKRRASGDIEEDMLQTLLDSTYKSGRHMTDDEISGMLVGLLLAGQHTSSTTGSWLAFFLAQNPEIQDACYQEQLKVFGENLKTIDYDGLKECQLLDRCLKESLRLRPPLLTMMRMCKTPQKVLGYTIPPGHQVCVSPPTSHHLPHVWKDVGKFKPDRFLEKVGCHSDEKFIYIPFGAGRHRCIGESFAYVQIKAIFSILLRLYHFELINDRFPEINLAMMIHTPKDPFIRYSPRKLRL